MLYSARLASFRKKNKWHGQIPATDMARAGFIFAPNPDAPDNCRCFTCSVDISGWDAEDDPLEEHLRHSSHCEWARVLGSSDHSAGDRLITFKNWPHPGTNFRPSPLALAQAGFFFNPGHNGDDATECAFCGICLNKWAANDNPLEEHRAANGNCEHVLRCFETSSLVDSHLVESSLGVIPVLQPNASVAPVLVPDETYEQSVYGNLLEDSAVYRNPKMENCQQKDLNTGTYQSDADPQPSVNTRSSLDCTDAYETAHGDSLLCEVQMVGGVEHSCSDYSHFATEQTDVHAGSALEHSHSENTPLAAEQTGDHGASSPENVTECGPKSDLTEKSTVTSESECDSSSSAENSSALNTPRDMVDESMVTVDVEEVSLNSTAAVEADLKDPETPSRSTPQPAPDSERPVLSVFKSAFTSTPFNRMSPTKMMSAAPMPSPFAAPMSSHHQPSAIMPSPLAALPIDLARTSFGNQQQDQSAQARMYPRLPSFPSMQAGKSFFDNDQFKEPYGQPMGIDNQDPGLTDPKIDATSTFHTAKGETDHDRSTPSPVRSPHRSSIIGSSPVRNSFDDLIDRLNADPQDVERSLLYPDQIPTLRHDSLEENKQNEQESPSHLDSQLSNMDIDEEKPAEITISAPNRKQLLAEFTRYLPPPSIEFLLQARTQTVQEWQLLLADEVECQILKVVEEAVEKAETQRNRVIQEIKAQYGY